MKEERTVRISPEEMAAQQAFAREFSSLPERPQTYYIVTYGCQMNAHDSEKLAGMLEEMGMTPAPAREEADFVLHNTCCIRDNAERNGVSDRLELYLPDAQPEAMKADVVVANILAGPLRELAPLISVLPVEGGLLGLSGILASQADSVCEAYADLFALDPVVEKEEWCRITGHKK